MLAVVLLACSEAASPQVTECERTLEYHERIAQCADRFDRGYATCSNLSGTGREACQRGRTREHRECACNQERALGCTASSSRCERE